MKSSFCNIENTKMIKFQSMFKEFLTDDYHYDDTWIFMGQRENDS